MVIVKTDFIKEFFISGGTLISKCGEVRQAVTTTDAATKKPVDAGQSLFYFLLNLTRVNPLQALDA